MFSPRRIRVTSAAWVLALFLPIGIAVGQEPPKEPSSEAERVLAEARRALVSELREQGIRLDLEKKQITFDAQICMDRGPLEYLLVGPGGATHESLLISGLQPSALNAAIKALGLKPGENIRYVKKDPPPTEEQLKDGEILYDIFPPEGDQLEIQIQWSADAKPQVHRAEACILNAETSKEMPETGWVYLGSRFVEIEPGAGEVFIADYERNIISIYQFEVRNSILVNPLRDAGFDDIWYANPRILPEPGTDVSVTMKIRASAKKKIEVRDDGD